MKEQINKFILNVSTYVLAMALTMYEIIYHYQDSIFGNHPRVSFLIILDYTVKLNLVYLIFYSIKLLINMIKARRERK